MRKALSVCCAAVLLMAALAGCKESAEKPSEPAVTQSAAPTSTPVPTPPIPFTDVPENSNYYDAVVWAYENGVASGGDTFEPLSTCTRGQAITFLWRAMGSPEPQLTESPVTDIAPSNWFYKPVLWAYESGISTSSTFKPNSPCTNGEALTFLWRAEGKPMASVSGSAVALAASGAYYERPAAWADNSGLFAQMGTAFDPSAPCSRAYLVSCLHWADGQRASAEKDRQLQAEYEKIIQDAKLYEVHGSGLVYADYVDVDGDGTVELLTVDSGKNLVSEEYANEIFSYDVVITVYRGVSGHAEKLCEKTFRVDWDECVFSTCTYDGYVCFDYESLVIGIGPQDDFYKIENGSFTASDSVAMVMDRFADSNGNDISEAEYNAVINKYTDKKMLFYYHRNSGLSVHERGILPVPKVEVNGSVVDLYAAYFSPSCGAFMVPICEMLEAMEVATYHVWYGPNHTTILASTKNDTLVITYKEFKGYYFDSINDDDDYYDGRDKTYKYSMNGGDYQKISIEFTDGTDAMACAPLYTIVSLFGGQAEWDGKTGAIQVTSNIPDSSRMTQDELKKIANFDVNQAHKVAVNNGYEYEKINFWANDGTVLGLTFKNGKAIWDAYVDVSYIYERDAFGDIVGLTIEQYPIEVASDGTVTAHPNDVIYRPSSQY